MLAKELQPSKAMSDISVTDWGRVMLSKELQFLKALAPTTVTDSGTMMLAKELQSAKAHIPMAVTDWGIVMLAKELQDWKANLPMAVTDSGIAMLVKELQRWKAPSPMAVTDSGIVMLSKDFAISKGTFPNSRHWLRGLPPWPSDCTLGRLHEEFRSQSRGYWLEGGPLHGLHLLLRLQLRFWSKWQSLRIRHATAPQTPASDHHLRTIRWPRPSLWGFCARWDLHNVSFHEALLSILEWYLSAWLEQSGHRLPRSSLSVRGGVAAMAAA